MFPSHPKQFISFSHFFDLLSIILTLNPKSLCLNSSLVPVPHGRKIGAATENDFAELQITESCINSYEGKLQDNAADRINGILDSNIPRGSLYYLYTEMSI